MGGATLSLGEIAALVGAEIPGALAPIPVTGVASLDDAGEGDIAFFANPKYLHAAKTTRATAILVPRDFVGDTRAHPLRVDNPSLAFARVLERFAPPPPRHAPGVHPTAVVAGDARLGEGVSIGPHAVVGARAALGRGTIVEALCFVGPDAALGRDCHLHPRVTVRERCVLGDRVILHSGVVVGSDGFGYEFQGGRHVKIPQIGIVEIGDDVEVGANSAIDRARFGVTRIGRGTKIDNLVHIAHNVVVGPDCILVAQVGISGSCEIGQGAILAGQVGVAGHLKIGEGAIVGAQAGVSKNVPPGEHFFGYPAMPMRRFKREMGCVGLLPKLFERVRELERRLGIR